MGMTTSKELIRIRRPPPFEHPTVDAFITALEGKAEYNPRANLYFRDGYPALGDREAQIGELVGADREHVLLCSAGMSAIVTAIEIANPTAGDNILHGFQGYNQVMGYITEDLQDRGVRPNAVNSGSIKDLQKAIKTHRPKIILLETVANGTEMAVLDVEAFLGLEVLRDVNPLIILDNTLPTDSNLPLASILRENRNLKVIGVESATKFYACNQESGGIIFTYDEDVLKKLQKKRRRIASILVPSAAKEIEKVIPPSKEQFDKFNRLTAWNTLQLAKACAEIQTVNGRFMISHPNLPSHPNSNYANLHHPNGATPLFFILPIYLDHIDLARVLWNNETIRKGHLAQSFGFARTGISFELNSPYIRIAGGLENQEEIEELKRAFRQILSSI